MKPVPPLGTVSAVVSVTGPLTDNAPDSVVSPVTLSVPPIDVLPEAVILSTDRPLDTVAPPDIVAVPITLKLPVTEALFDTDRLSSVARPLVLSVVRLVAPVTPNVPPTIALLVTFAVSVVRPLVIVVAPADTVPSVDVPVTDSEPLAEILAALTFASVDVPFTCSVPPTEALPVTDAESAVRPEVTLAPVSYTHLTLPTILRV